MSYPICEQCGKPHPSSTVCPNQAITYSIIPGYVPGYVPESKPSSIFVLDVTTYNKIADIEHRLGKLERRLSALECKQEAPVEEEGTFYDLVKELSIYELLDKLCNPQPGNRLSMDTVRHELERRLTEAAGSTPRQTVAEAFLHAALGISDESSCDYGKYHSPACIFKFWAIEPAIARASTFGELLADMAAVLEEAARAGPGTRGAIADKCPVCFSEVDVKATLEESRNRECENKVMLCGYSYYAPYCDIDGNPIWEEYCGCDRAVKTVTTLRQQIADLEAQVAAANAKLAAQTEGDYWKEMLEDDGYDAHTDIRP